jgi:hypothetical protein
MLRRRRQDPADPFSGVDPSAMSPRWSPFVADALDARRQWQDVVAGVRPGPTKDRLAELSALVDRGVLAIWETARDADGAERLAAQLDADQVTADHKRALRDPSVDPALRDALAARFASVQRILNAIDEADERLTVLDARLGATVARSIELSVTAGDAGDVGAELDAVIVELDAVRSSLASLS